MKYKKPEIVPMFKTTSGEHVETLELWQRFELESLLSEPLKGDEGAIKGMGAYLLAHAAAFVAILGIVERKGRPVGAKDKKPRKKAVTAPPE